MAIIDETTVFFLEEDGAMRNEMDDAGLRLFDHWCGLRGPTASAPPRKSSMDPLDFPYALPGIVLVDVDGPPESYRYRLVGTRDVDERGMDPTGRLVGEEFFGGSVDLVLGKYEYARRGTPFLTGERFRKNSGIWVTDVSTFMPLAGLDGAVVCVMVYSYLRRDAWSDTRGSI